MAEMSEATRTFQQQRQLTASPEIQGIQEVYWKDRANNKRGPPTPIASGLTTPQKEATHAASAASSSPSLVQPWTIQDHTAAQLTASTFGVDINSTEALEEWLSKPVHTNKDVMGLMRSYHEKVVRPEMYHLVLQLETALSKIGDDVFKSRQELAWMAADNRLQQKYASALQIITSGWPTGMTPPHRHFMIGWMLQQVPKIKVFLQGRNYVNEANEEETEPYMNVFSSDPVTVPQGEGFWSGMTLLHFKSFELRSQFLERYGGQGGTPIYSGPTTPLPGKHVRVSPCSPQWQRKLESPLRVLINLLNNDEEHSGMSLVLLWKTLTLMAPTKDRDFKPDHTAWARLFYIESSGHFRGRLEITPQLKAVMGKPPVNVGEEPDAWSESWNAVIWGNQYTMDQAEHQLFKRALAEAQAGGKGLNVGKGRKHWSNTVIHNDYFSPYPYELDIQVVDQAAFCWDEYAQKMSKPEECVGDFGIATFAGKPPLPTNAGEGTAAASTEDVDMPPAETTPPPQSGKGAGSMPPPKNPSKGGGKAAKKAAAKK